MFKQHESDIELLELLKDNNVLEAAKILKLSYRAVLERLRRIREKTDEYGEYILKLVELAQDSPRVEYVCFDNGKLHKNL